MFIKVKVFPKSKHELLVEKDDGRFEVHTKARAQDNRANESVRESLAQFLGVSTQKIRLIAGHHSPNKIFEVLE